MNQSLNNLNLYNEFGASVSSSQAKQAVQTTYERQLETVKKLFQIIVNTIKDKWARFMGMIDDNLAKIKNRIDVSQDPEATSRLKHAFFKMQQVKKFDNPMKRVLMKANMIFSKTQNANSPEVILQAKEQLKEQRQIQKNTIDSAKTVLEEAKSMLSNKQ